MNALVMDRPYDGLEVDVARDALEVATREDVLRELEAVNTEKYLSSSNEYIQQMKICANIFKKLRENLSGSQLLLLLDYDEAHAIKEGLMVQLLQGKMSKI